MNKIKALLLPLAIVFAAIAVFEFGARYGASNMRAYAIASEMQLPLRIYSQSNAAMDPATRATFELMIDNSIAAGALHRKVWHLDQDSRKQLEKALTVALSIRGNAVFERFENTERSGEMPSINHSKLVEIQDAVRLAKMDLVDNAANAKTDSANAQAE